MLKKIILCLCLITFSLKANSSELVADATDSLLKENSCEEKPTCEDKLTWKKFLLASGVFVIGVVTFVFVGINNNK